MAIPVSARPIVGGVLGVSALVVFLACGGDGGDGDALFPQGSSGGVDSGASSGFDPSDNPGTGPGEPCVAKEAEAIEGKRPVDIIFVIDNSESMGEEIAEVERQINENFASIIEGSNADYRVIMISGHGEQVTVKDEKFERICVRSPLSGTNCAPVPEAPVETTKFVHYNVKVGSTDAWSKILETFRGPADESGAHAAGWAPFLRATAFKVFAVITDDRVKTKWEAFDFDDKNNPASGEIAASRFDAALQTLSPQFGSAERRNYVWHSIVGLAPYDQTDLTKPYPSDAAITRDVCGPTAVAAATGYQALSRLTGGLRYPTCGLDFTPIFRAMAQDVIGRSVLACDYAMPTPTSGTIDPATAVVRYTSGANQRDFEQVASEDACGADKFFIQGDRIKLCGDACLTVQNDPAAQVKILFGCLPKQAK